MDITGEQGGEEGEELIGDEGGVEKRVRRFCCFVACMIERKRGEMEERRGILVLFEKTSILFRNWQKKAYSSEAPPLGVVVQIFLHILLTLSNIGSTQVDKPSA